MPRRPNAIRVGRADVAGARTQPKEGCHQITGMEIYLLDLDKALERILAGFERVSLRLAVIEWILDETGLDLH